MGSDCRVGPDIQVYDDGVGISVLTVALPSHDTDVSRATFCQTDLVALGTLSLDKGRILRKELSRLTNENCGLKEKLTSKEITLESLRDHKDTVRYFTGMTDFMTQAAIFNFVNTHLPFEMRRAPSPFQVQSEHPSATSCVYISRSTASKAVSYTHLTLPTTAEV